MSKKKEVKYMKKLERSEGMVLPEYGRKRVDTLFIKQYVGALESLFQLSPRASRLLDFLLTKMDSFNIVQTTKHTRDSFNALMEKAGLQPYSQSNIMKGIKELAEKKFLIKQDRGVYLVNPEFYDAGTEGQRLKKVQVLLEFQAGTRGKISVEHIYEDFIITDNEC